MDDANYPDYVNNGHPEFLYSDTGASGLFLDVGVGVDVDASSIRLDIVDRSSISPGRSEKPLKLAVPKRLVAGWKAATVTVHT